MRLLERIPVPWTENQRKVILWIVAILVGYGAIRLFFNRAYVSDPQPLLPPRAVRVADKIDPNVADAPTLAALPMIGEKRAADIVAYRERVARDYPGEVAFKSPDDLLKIRGIGASIVDQISPYLMFPTTIRPSSQP